MIWGGVWGALPDRWQWAMAGIARNWQDGDELDVVTAPTIADGYNRILERHPGQRIVLLHDDTELGDGAREIIESSAFDVTGVVGGVGLKALAWWTAKHKVGAVQMQNGLGEYEPHGPADTVDGLILCLSPEATGLRFDTGYDGFHGYDADLCFQARTAGLTVGTAPIPHTHQTRGGYGDRSAWDRAAARFKGRWL